MNLIVIAALAAVCGAAKLDRTYLPPASAQTAGGSAGSLQTPFEGASFRSQGNQGLGGIPKGAYSNDFGGVVVDAAAAGTRAAGPEESGLGAPRPSYGSQASKVGDAAFRGAPVAGFRQFPNAQQSNEDSANAATNGNPSARFRGGNGGQGLRNQVSSTAFAGNQPSRFNRPSFSAEPVEAERPNAEQDRSAGIVRYDSEVGTDNYRYSFETDNGISAEENGVTTNGVQAQGGFSYTGDDGQTYSVTYTADENGYQPKGDHLPTPPPIPDAILKSLAKNAEEEAAGLSDDGSYDAQKYNAGSDYNESDNINGRYNGGQSNKGSGNRAIATADAAGGFANQNNDPSIQQNQNVGNAQNLNGFNQQSSQIGQANNAFGNNKGFTQSTSSLAGNGFGQAPENNAFGVASQSLGSAVGGFGQSFQGSFSQQNQVQGFDGQSNNQFNQQIQAQESSVSNNFGQQTQKQGSRFSNNNNFNQQKQVQSSGFDDQTSGTQFGQQNQENSFGSQASSTNNFSQQINSPVNGLESQSTSNQELGLNPQLTQSQTSFAAPSFGNTNKFNQQTQTQSSRFASQKFGYLPPKQNGGSGSQDIKKIPETPSFNSQFQSSSQKFTGETNPIRPTKQPEIGLTTPFETPQFESASKPASQNGQFGQNQKDLQSAGQFTQASTRVQQPQRTFSQPPLNQGFRQFPQKDSIPPQSQNFRQQNVPVFNAPTKIQSSASAFASFNSQETITSTNNYDDNIETTTGVAYTDTSPTTESFVQFAPNKQASEKLNQTPQNQFQQTPRGQFNQASQNQFNQGPRNQNSPNQFLSSTQRPFSQNNLAQQQNKNSAQVDSYYYNQPSSPFRTPETNQNNFQSASSGQFDRVNEQPKFNEQSGSMLMSPLQQGQFGSRPNFQRQQSTKYPRPPTLPATAPTSIANIDSETPQTTFQSQFTNGVTQASASSFASNAPGQFNGNAQRFPQRQQSFQTNSQITQSFSKPQSQQTTAVPTSFNQQNQYGQSGNGFNQFTGFQDFSQRLTGTQQFGNQQTTEEPTTEGPASTYEGEIYQYNKPAEVLPAPSQDPTPQGSEETPVQLEAKKPEQNTQRLGQFQENQFSQDFGQQVDERGQFGQESAQFAGASATFKADDSASSVAGKGEVFGGPREPPSFDEDTGYHY